MVLDGGATWPVMPLVLHVDSDLARAWEFWLGLARGPCSVAGLRAGG